VPVNEILFGCTSLSNMIREGGTHKISSLIESSRGEGMQLMDDAIFSRLEDGLVSRGEALRYAVDKTRFEAFEDQHRTVKGN
jgi:twitching motility protein PilT